MKQIIVLGTALLALVMLSSCVHSAMYTSRIEAEYPPQGEFKSFEDGRIHVVSRGQGDPVLMIHGASANHREFVFTLLPEIDTSDIEAILPDRPGHGHTSRFENSFQLGKQAEIMAVAAADFADEPMVVVGHSFGGAVALRFALDYPERTKAVVLIAPVTHDWGSGGITWYNQIASVPVIGPAFSQFAPLVGPDMARKSLDNLFSPAPVPPNYADNLGVDLLFRPKAFRANARDMTSLQEEIREQQDRYAREINVPVVVFSGSGDTVIKPSLHAARLKRELPEHTVLVKLPDEGHMPHHRKAALISETIARLVRGGEVQTSDFQS